MGIFRTEIPHVVRHALGTLGTGGHVTRGEQLALVTWAQGFLPSVLVNMEQALRLQSDRIVKLESEIEDLRIRSSAVRSAARKIETVDTRVDDLQDTISDLASAQRHESELRSHQIENLSTRLVTLHGRTTAGSGPFGVDESAPGDVAEGGTIPAEGEHRAGPGHKG